MLPHGKMCKSIGVVEHNRLMRIGKNFAKGSNARRETPLDVLGANIMASNLHAMANSGQCDFRRIHADIKEPNPIPQRIRFPNTRHRRFPRKRRFLVE